MRNLKACGALLAALLAAACSPVGEGTSLSGIRVADSGGRTGASSVFECAFGQIHAIADFGGDGSESSDFSSRVRWSSSDPDVLFVGDGIHTAPGALVYTPGGYVAMRPGTATITATYDSFRSTLVVEVLPIPSLRIAPALTDVGEHTAQQFSLEGQLKDGGAWVDIGSTAAWDFARATSAASVGDASGLLSAGSAAATPVRLRATLAGCDRDVETSLRISPVQALQFDYEAGAGAVMPLNLSELIHVYATFATPGSTPQEVSGQVLLSDYDDGVILPTQADDGIMVDAAGLEGDSSLTAELEDQGIAATSKTWQVEETDLTGLAVSPAYQEISFPATGSIAATGSFANGLTWPVTRYVNWSSDSGDLAIETGGAEAGKLTPNDVSHLATVTAQVEDYQGKQLYADAKVQVRAWTR